MSQYEYDDNERELDELIEELFFWTGVGVIFYLIYFR